MSLLEDNTKSQNMSSQPKNNKKKKEIPMDLVIPDKKPKLTKQQRRELQNKQRAAKKKQQFLLSQKTDSIMNNSTTLSSSSSSSKIVYLIRHGESEGQVAKQKGIDRKRDMCLLDAKLTSKGQQQARDISKYLMINDIDDDGIMFSKVDLVISSPLTRAIHTSILGFCTTATVTGSNNASAATRSSCEVNNNNLIHYDICEIGSNNPLPENIPRRIEDVLAELSHDYDDTVIDGIDYESCKPEIWPPPLASSSSSATSANNGIKSSSTTGKNSSSPKSDNNKRSHEDKHQRISEFFLWLAQCRKERIIAVVCHYNVIRAALGPQLKPINALPIKCELTSDGQLFRIK